MNYSPAIDTRVKDALRRIESKETTLHDELQQAFAASVTGPISLQINTASALDHFLAADPELVPKLRASIVPAVQTKLVSHMHDMVKGSTEVQRLCAQAKEAVITELKEAFGVEMHAGKVRLTKETATALREGILRDGGPTIQSAVAEYVASPEFKNVLHAVLASAVQATVGKSFLDILKALPEQQG